MIIILLFLSERNLKSQATAFGKVLYIFCKTKLFVYMVSVECADNTSHKLLEIHYFNTRNIFIVRKKSTLVVK